ncbi:nucleotidyl transferase AbiEii/AbiGii toxin family protein [Agromyces aerolatus]|uniref:nucleotidyl transferase AbiEii/AbiGii toxin family protein n=1 Tax=Agromyces sp. LY-1074 TaxID=3074080 RepID=UPI0028586A19|nr:MULTISPECIES: nucleotidyl transferase AbiEii/AbiGii toxin family protein [unclassified Agromyces]MDR5698497.1 nucleotidyl transferase AbiEii/AbiGii toxin family protein [Agromyces sp. LY-1074]MDR5704791.1 nucleotidyl transferase AbiEii/AbiGii toxin family protein [Agromyces sp. LY-1358]
MTEPEKYGSPAAVESAINAAARRANAADPSLTVQERVRLEYFNRFLSRIFSEPDNTEWMLKGGTSMLARVPSARATVDVDLFRANRSIDAALDDLRRLAVLDLGDFFRFEYLDHTSAVGGDQQTSTEGYGVRFDVYVGVKRKNPLHVDLVVNALTTGDADTASPANALDLPRLPSHPYRLYPVVDQIADKVCATLVRYGGHPSSREKDLVDLVVLAVTQDVDAHQLRRALEGEARNRSLALPVEFTVPAAWGARYAKLAAPLPACTDFRTVVAATGLMRSFLDPILAGGAEQMAWHHDLRAWMP